MQRMHSHLFKKKKSEIEITAQITICQIISSNKRGNKNNNITGMPQTTVKLNNQNSQLQCAIFHEGADVQKGYYKSIICIENSWM